LSVTLGFIGREYVSFIGATHGLLFIVYIMLSLNVCHKQNWSVLVWLLVLFASIVPFAFIVIELFLRKELGKVKAA